MLTSPDKPESSEYLLRLIEAAPQVRRRYQFFMWTQGDLQRWLPHRLLVCGAYDRDHRNVVFDVFNNLPVPDIALKSLHDGRDGLTARAMNAWRQQRLAACRLQLADLPHPDGGLEALMGAGYLQMVVHGVCRPGRPDEVESFFMFGSPERAMPDNALQSIDMLLPCLHATYQRVHTTERQMAGNSALRSSTGGINLPRVGAITEREREILMRVRDGLNNQQISEKLGISALTVKNHIQKILRKMESSNRAQAVAKAMTLNLLNPSSEGQHPSDEG